MLENTEGAINNGQSRETDNIDHTRHKTKTKKPQQCTAGRWFSTFTNKTDRHDIIEILLKVALCIITPIPCDRSVVFSGYSGFLHQ